LPTVNETIAHLKVLEAFSKLRQTVGSTERLFWVDFEALRQTCRLVSLHIPDLVLAPRTRSNANIGVIRFMVAKVRTTTKPNAPRSAG
jgi:hypothetical protein